MKKPRLFALTAALLAMLMVITACGKKQEAIPETTIAAEEPAKTRSVVEILTSEVFTGEMSVDVKTQYIYDEQGLMKAVVSWFNGEESSRAVIENDHMGEVIRQTSVSNGVTTVTESENTYDEAGNLIKKVDTVSSDGNVTDIREYHYNADHQHTHVKFSILGENPVTITTRYEYDSLGNQTAEHQETNGISSSVLTEYEYDDQNRISKATKTNGNGAVTGYTEYTYESDGHRILNDYLPDGTPLSKIVYTYDENGQTVQRETWYADVLSQRTTYTYITVPAFK